MKNYLYALAVYLLISGVVATLRQEASKNRAPGAATWFIHVFKDQSALRTTLERAGFSNPKVEFLGSRFRASGHHTHMIHLGAVIFRGLGWNPEEVLYRLGVVAETYEQCGVYVGSVVLVESDPIVIGQRAVTSFGQADAENEKSPNYRIAVRAPLELPRPLIFYMGENQEPSEAVSYQDYGDTPLSNTVWIGSSHQGDRIRADVLPGYTSEAHELAHVLTGTTWHLRDGRENILANEFSLRTNTLTAEQCAVIRGQSTVTRL